MSQQNTLMDKEFILFAIKASRLMNEGKLPNALNLGEAGVKRFPSYAPGHFILGLCYEANNQTEEAKNEFERTLVFDPGHTKARQKLVKHYEANGLQEMANECLIEAAYYNPLNQELIEDIKSKGLYDRLKSVADVKEKMPLPDAASTPMDPEVDIKEETEPEPLSEHETDTVDLTEDPTEKSSKTEPEPEEEKPAEPEIAADKSDQPEEELPAIEKLDPLSANVQPDEKDLDEDDSDKPRRQDLSQYANLEDDFSTIMEGYFDKEEAKPEKQESDTDDWIEVENLLLDEEFSAEEENPDEEDLIQDESYREIDPMSEETQDETELLLEQLSSSDVEGELEDNIDDEIADTPEKREELFENADSDDTILVVDDLDNQNYHEHIEETGKEEEEQPPQEPAREEEKETGFKFKELKRDSVDTSSLEEEVTIKDLMENPNLVTPTFGEILIAQRKFSEARHVFLELSKRDPENTRIQKKIQFLDKFLEVQNSV